MKIAVFISGTGTNLKALLDAKRENYFKSDIVCVVSNKNAAGLEFAKNFNVDTFVSTNDEEIIDYLKRKNVNLIVLAGFLPKISKRIINEFTIVNIHPSLLPKFGGKGCYGIHVHEKVFANEEKISGATVHFVNEKLDDGDILLQRTVDISDCKNPDEIAKKVLKIEHGILKDAVKKLEESSCER